MEPRREKPQNVLEPSAARKPNRFRIIKLEERIAPSNAGGTGTGHCAWSAAKRNCTDTCWCGGGW